MMKRQMIMQKNIQTANRKVSHGSMALVFLSALLVLSLVYPSSSKSQTSTETVVTPNYLPEMEDHTRSGGTKVNTGTGTSQGCKSGNFCTAGKQGPGGTYSSTFDLETNMTIGEINSGFTMNYGMDVDSHQSNVTVPSCVGGNTLQGNDCKDIFNLKVKLFDGTALKHSFEHTVELDFNGVRNFAFSQTIPENTYSSLTGTWDMFGIDAGFGNKFFGPAFSAPFLTTTFDIVTLIETEVIDIINNTDILEQNTPEDIQVETIEVEVETQDGQQMASLELEVNTEMTMELELEMPSMDLPEPTQEVQVEVAEVSAEIETEMNNGSEMATDQPVEPTEPQTESGTDGETQTSEGSESTTEGESREQDGEPSTDNESTGDGGEPETNQTPSSEENQDAQSAEPQQKPKAKVKVAKPKKSAKQKAANKIVKKMGDKGRYDSTNQLKTLVIMNVLTDSKKFLVQPTIPQPTGFFTDTKMPDAQLPENNAAAWMLMGGSNQLHDRLTGLQYKEK